MREPDPAILANFHFPYNVKTEISKLGIVRSQSGVSLKPSSFTLFAIWPGCCVLFTGSKVLLEVS